MPAPNLINANTINGKTVGANLTTTSATTVLNNPSNSGKCLKINTLNIANYGTAIALVTINYSTGASLSGANLAIAGNMSIPGGTTLNVIDKTSQYYMEENTSLGAISSVANTLMVTVSYEDIS
jgi:hypothetical protein